MTVLYHYCSNDAFHSIVQNHSIWLSSLSLSSDSMEGKLVAEIVARLSKDDGLDEVAARGLQQRVAGLETLFDGLGFCLSEEGDLLSQWRGYAADASGVSIGFSKEYLDQLAETTKSDDKAGFSLHKVEYEYPKQEELVRPTYEEMKGCVDKGAFRLPGKRLLDWRSDEEIEKQDRHIKKAYMNLSIAALPLFTQLFLLKAKAFREEREWRLISYFARIGDDQCKFTPKGDRIVPYREYGLLRPEASIVEVVIGPKNLTPTSVVESFMSQNGFANVKVVRSEATYR